MIYIALLRGINVGGKNKINMKELVKSFENTGMNEVSSYINSGNILFSCTDYNEEEIISRLEVVILEDFGLDIKVLLRDKERYMKMIEALPENWSNDAQMKSDVMFLWNEIDSKDILDKLTIKEGIDHVIYADGAVLWSTSKKDAGKSGKMKLATSPLYKKMTVRNINTVRKIAKLFI